MNYKIFLNIFQVHNSKILFLLLFNYFSASTRKFKATRNITLRKGKGERTYGKETSHVHLKIVQNKIKKTLGKTPL